DVRLLVVGDADEWPLPWPAHAQTRAASGTAIPLRALAAVVRNRGARCLPGACGRGIPGQGPPLSGEPSTRDCRSAGRISAGGVAGLTRCNRDLRQDVRSYFIAITGGKVLRG